ncbi:sensor histidine kinase [Metabacillus arenae]|uniref:histidine kinase n=1 Tax=Metabacillus arenae TaxID=2771434 RepID=A0A926NG91_9BACI|nr:sensor histidine kinase [Metabacillus arenae]MBD1382889.1 histidine kinase [Metabacillus arenae]
MKTIRNKLLLYFFVFVVLFNIVSVSIYFSSSRMLNEYNRSFERFLLLNEISQQAASVYDVVNAYVVEKDQSFLKEFQTLKLEFLQNKESLGEKLDEIDEIQLKKYQNLMSTLITESELTMGFMIRDDLNQYTFHLRETRNTSSYIQESTIQLIDLELSEYQVSYEEMKKRNEAFKWFTLFLFISTVLLAVFLALWFSKGITRPIHRLSQAAREISVGKLDGQEVVVESNDEMKLLSDTFNHMRQNIRELIVEIKEKSELDQLLNELELKHLQNQINPHFLFNTLNTISRMAYLEDAKVSSRLIESVSTLLRYSLGDLKKSVTLREEVNVVREYFYIQKTRFADRIQFVTTIDEEGLDLKVPSLTLQPLIENSFIHGVESYEEGGVITLRVSDHGDHVSVEVSDNGVGMGKQKIQNLLLMQGDEENHVGHSTGIGLKNVIRRLQLFYKNEDVVHILSKLGEGTTITLRLPKGGNAK